MPTYVLEGGAHAMLPAQPLTVRIRGGSVRARARRADGSDAPGVLNPGGGILVVPSLSDELVIRVEPDTGQFPPGTVLDVTVSPESRKEVDPDQATISGVDVSGLSGRDLLRLQPASGRVRVTALGIRVDTPLPPLAAAVRDAARGLLQVEALDPAEAVDLQVVVDASASMRALAETEEVTAAAEILLGLSRVIGGRFTAAVGSTRHPAIPAEPVTAIPGAITAALLAEPLRTGFRPPSPTHGAVQVTVSDAPPLAAPGPAGRRHGLVLTPRTTWPALQGRRAQVTLVPVGETLGPHAGGPRLADQLLGDEPLVGAITGSLLRGVLPAELTERLQGAVR